MDLVKRSFANIIGVINITFSLFSLTKRRRQRDGLCATVRFRFVVEFQQ